MRRREGGKYRGHVSQLVTTTHCQAEEHASHRMALYWQSISRKSVPPHALNHLSIYSILVVPFTRLLLAPTLLPIDLSLVRLYIHLTIHLEHLYHTPHFTNTQKHLHHPPHNHLITQSFSIICFFSLSLSGILIQVKSVRLSTAPSLPKHLCKTTTQFFTYPYTILWDNHTIFYISVQNFVV